MSRLAIDDPAAHVRRIRLDDPESRNALTAELRAELLDALASAAGDDDVHVLLLAGHERAFCSGGALGSIEREAIDSVRAHFRDGPQAVVARIATFEKPVIAVLDGASVGVGLDMALAADIRIASDRARFHTGFLRLALPPLAGGAPLLTRAMGSDRALRAYWEADFIDARRAADLRLVTEVVAPEELDGRGLELGEQIAGLSQPAVRATKQLVRGADADAVRDNLDTAAHHGAACVMTDDYVEALDSVRTRDR